MSTDLNSIIVTIVATVSIVGILSGLIVGHYYSRRALSKGKLTRAEFNQGIILMSITGFFSIAGFGCGTLFMDFLESEPVSVAKVVTISFLCLVLPPLFTAGVFIWEFRSKGWVE